MPGKERVVDSRHVYRGRAIHVRVDSVVKPNDKKTTREVVEHVDCVVILPVDSQGNVLLVRQYRHAVDRELLELAAGSIDPGETPEQAASPRAAGGDRLQAGQAGGAGWVLRRAGLLHGVPALLPGDPARRRAR